MARKRMTRKKAAPCTPQCDAYLIALVIRRPGKSTEFGGVGIYSESDPTRAFMEPQMVIADNVLLARATGRDFTSAYARIIRRMKCTPLLAWLLPWVEEADGAFARAIASIAIPSPRK